MTTNDKDLRASEGMASEPLVASGAAYNDVLVTEIPVEDEDGCSDMMFFGPSTQHEALRRLKQAQRQFRTGHYRMGEAVIASLRQKLTSHVAG